MRLALAIVWNLCVFAFCAVGFVFYAGYGDPQLVEIIALSIIAKWLVFGSDFNISYFIEYGWKYADWYFDPSRRDYKESLKNK